MGGNIMTKIGEKIFLDHINNILPDRYGINCGADDNFYIFDRENIIHKGDWALSIQSYERINIFRSTIDYARILPTEMMIYKIKWSTNLDVSEMFAIKWESI